jgi:imidazolonepropionase-like amidohydrolase
VVRAAHRRRVNVAAHAFGLDSVRDAVAAGVDTIEHCSCQTPDGPVVDVDLLRRMAAAGIAAPPTAGAGPAALLALDLDRVPPAVRDKVAALQRSIPKAIDLAKATVDAGVPLLAGTDAGIPQRPLDTLVDAVICFCDPDGLALTPAEALATATTTVADTCGLPDRGRLAPACGPTCWPSTATLWPPSPTCGAPASSCWPARRSPAPALSSRGCRRRPGSRAGAAPRPRGTPSRGTGATRR